MSALAKPVREYQKEPWYILSTPGDDEDQELHRLDNEDEPAMEEEEEEKPLQKKGEGVDHVRLYLKEIGQYPLIGKKEERALALKLRKALKKGDYAAAEKAKNHLVNANLRLVVNVAKKYVNHGLDLLDLVQEGNIGLMKAAEEFKPEFGCRFSTYATKWIKAYITRSLTNQSRTIRIPAHMSKFLSRVNKASKALRHEKGPRVEPKDIAEKTKFPLEKVRKFFEIPQQSISIEGLDDAENKPFSGQDRLDISCAPLQIEGIEKLLVKEHLKNMLKFLNEREEKIIRLRYGLDNGGHILTQGEVGSLLNLTRQRVSQIETRALEKLRHPSRMNQLAALLS